MHPLTLLIRSLACLFLWVAGLGASQAGVLRVCISDVPHAPWRVPQADGQLQGRGLDFELLREFERHSRWRVDLQVLSGRRRFVELQMGRADATVGLSHTPDRALYLRYPMLDGQPNPALALRTEAYWLYARPGAEVHWDGQQLRLPAGGKVAAQAGHSVVHWLREQGHPVEEGPRNADQVLQAVAGGAVPTAAVLAGEGEALRRTHPALAELRRIEPALVTRPYFVVFSSTFAQQHEAQLPQLWHQFAIAARRNPAYALAARELQRSLPH